MKVGVLPIARSTFDLALAGQKLDGMRGALQAAGVELFGSTDALLDRASTERAIADLVGQELDGVVVLQLTFTDATSICLAAESLAVPLAMWAIPEPRCGQRLRLNSFCGMNLASHALGRRGVEVKWLFRDPSDIECDELTGWLGDDFSTTPGPSSRPVGVVDRDRGEELVETLRGCHIARLGIRPEGFDTCDFEPDQVRSRFGVEITPIGLGEFFRAAERKDPTPVEIVRGSIAAACDGLEDMDQGEVDRSCRLQIALRDLAVDQNFDAFAVRCWPEMFTEYGGAVCGVLGLMADERTPGACEVDVFGSLTQLILQDAAQAPVFLTDLVDFDGEDNSAVVWHCGQAPLSMLAHGQRPVATVHPNRGMALLFEFPLKPGRVTLFRLSQARGELSCVTIAGEVLDRPLAFSGTSGVLRFDRSAADVLADIMALGIEHHVAVAYGDHRPALRGFAAALDLPIYEL